MRVERRYSQAEKRKLLARMIQLGVRECFRHHCYRFKGDYFVQLEGGPIGLDLTGVVAELVMEDWNERFIKKMSENKIEILMDDIYVDDQDLLVE